MNLEPLLPRIWTAFVASFLTMAFVTVGGVFLFFRPIAEAEDAATEWHPLIAILVYLTLSVFLFDWTTRRVGSAYTAAFVIAAAQLIFIVDLFARGERGILTAIAGAALVAATWFAVAFVHSWMTGQGNGRR